MEVHRPLSIHGPYDVINSGRGQKVLNTSDYVLSVHLFSSRRSRSYPSGSGKYLSEGDRGHEPPTEYS